MVPGQGCSFNKGDGGSVVNIRQRRAEGREMKTAKRSSLVVLVIEKKYPVRPHKPPFSIPTMSIDGSMCFFWPAREVWSWRRAHRSFGRNYDYFIN